MKKIPVLFDRDFLRSYFGLRDFFLNDVHPIEGIVFWLDGEPAAKIRRKDFGLSWPVTSQ